MDSHHQPAPCPHALYPSRWVCRPCFDAAVARADEAERLLRLAGVRVLDEDPGDRSLAFLRKGHSPELADISIAISLASSALRVEAFADHERTNEAERFAAELGHEVRRQGKLRLETALKTGAVIQELRGEAERLQQVADNAEELVECAGLRGDNVLPHPADDPELWTGRMQDAWDNLEESLQALPAPTADEESK